MESTFWHRQVADKPLFPDMLWARPENKRLRGKLLIVGGNKFGFAAVATSFAAAQRAGAGACRILLPNALERVVGTSLAEAEFAPSTPSGSFSRQALARLLELSDWADGVLLAGDFGRNSETAIMLERFLDEYEGQVTLQQDALDYFWGKDSPLLGRTKTTSIINLGKLQKLAKVNRPATPVLNSMSLKDLVDLLHDWSADKDGIIVTRHAENYMAAISGQVSTTPADEDKNWQVTLGAHVSVWQAQQPARPFEALSSAIYSLNAEHRI